MSTRPDGPPVRISSPAGLLAVIPHLLGFIPERSLVVLGAAARAGRVEIAFRYDLPGPPGTAVAADIAARAAGVLSRQHLSIAVAAGYGPGPLVTPVIDALRVAARRARVELYELLRVEDGRYWSYLCRERCCCSPGGVRFDAAAHPVARALAALSVPVLASRAEMAAGIAPLSGPVARAMAEATVHAERVAARLLARTGPRALDGPGLAAVRAAIGVYREGGSMTPAVLHAWLALVLTRPRIRDDAWARMDPQHRVAHRRLWTDVVRRARPGYVAVPACLLAVTLWQGGEGALANIALDRALADHPGYSLALLLRDLLDAGAPPSAAAPPMTPDQVAESYAEPAAARDAASDARPGADTTSG